MVGNETCKASAGFKHGFGLARGRFWGQDENCSARLRRLFPERDRGLRIGVGLGFLWTMVFRTTSFEGYYGMLVIFTFMPIGTSSWAQSPERSDWVCSFRAIMLPRAPAVHLDLSGG